MFCKRNVSDVRISQGGLRRVWKRGIGEARFVH